MPYMGREPTSTATKLEDADQDTKIQVEESSDEDTIRFDTGGTERMTVASGGAVDVVGALTAGTVTSDAGVAGTTGIFSSDVTGLTLNATGDTSAGDNAAIGYTSAEGLILTGQGSTDDITIKNDADTTVMNVATGDTNVEISAGNLLFGNGSSGVYLGVTSATAANLLNDYEEGTWTPGLSWSTGGATSVAYTDQVGLYTKIGKMVNVSFHLQTSNNGTGSGAAIITGLPFTVHNSNSAYGASLVTNYRAGFSADHYPGGYATKNDTTIYLQNLDPDSTETSGISESDWTNTGRVYGSLTYRSTT